MGTSAIQQCNPRAKSGIEALHALQLRDADAVRELLTDAQQRTAQLQADLMQARQDTQQASLAYQRGAGEAQCDFLHPLMPLCTIWCSQETHVHAHWSTAMC